MLRRGPWRGEGGEPQLSLEGSLAGPQLVWGKHRVFAPGATAQLVKGERRSLGDRSGSDAFPDHPGRRWGAANERTFCSKFPMLRMTQVEQEAE